MPDKPTSSRDLSCPFSRWRGETWDCGAYCALWDAVLDTCAIRAINDLLHSIYGD